jgi:hypothetical protein
VAGMAGTQVATSAEVRAEAVRRLIDQLDVLVMRQRLAQLEGVVLGDQAELLTGEVARYLAGARATIAAVPMRR